MTRKARRLLVVLVAAVVVVVGGAVVVFAAGGGGSGNSFAAHSGTPATSTAVATASEQTSSSAPAPASSPAYTATDSPSAVETSAASSSSPLPGRTVDVTLGYADWDSAGEQVEAAGFVAGVVQSGGICTLTLARAGASVPVRNTAEADATTTNCGAFHVPGARLAPGQWQVTLTYQSATAHGTSAAMTVTVPAA